MSFDLIAALFASVSAHHSSVGQTGGLSPAESLTTAITMEGLLFAAFAVGTKLTEVTEEGRSPFFSQAWFGWCIVGVISIVAIAAFASWWEVFGTECVKSFGHLILGAGLALGIIAQPIFAAVINVESKRV